MPYYGIPVGQTKEEVGFGFNKEIITELLRDSLKFDGVVCTDWNIINTMPLAELAGGERSWGVENLTPEQRMKKAILAGLTKLVERQALNKSLILSNEEKLRSRE